MDVEAALRKRLIDNEAVAALVGDRVYWVDRIQAETYPGITLQVFNEELAQHLKGFHSLQMLEVQLDGWARSHAAGKAIKDAVIACLIPAAIVGNYRFNRAFARARDLSEKDDAGTIFRPSLDFTFHYSIIP